MQAVVVVLCAVLGMLNAAPWSPSTTNAPKPCCLPDQIQMEMGESIAYVSHDHPGLTQLGAWIATDYTKKKMAAKTMGFSEGHSFNMTVIADYETLVMYMIDEDKKTCTKGKVPPTQIPGQCLPDDAKYMGTIKFGMGTTISGDSWLMKVKDEQSKTDLEVFLTLTSDSCVPINEAVKGRMGEMGLFVGMSYYNIKNSIDDPSVFNIPDICKKEDVVFTENLPSSSLQNFLVAKQVMN